MNTPSTPLSHRLRAETKEAHTTAERSGIMRSLLGGTISPIEYVRLLDNLAALYEALETELDAHSGNAALSGVSWNALRRLPSLQQDIAALTNSLHRADIKPSTRAYVEHLHALGRQSPELIFAHAYLRYLGDLYGGQIIRRIVVDTFGEGVDDAISFYKFSNIRNLPEFKSEFRDAIDAITPEMANHDTLVAEAMRGYELHAQIFQELEG
ncbi:MAG: biliverdin-producing heme oxygenase [Gemmatimonadaceae bacterium]